MKQIRAKFGQGTLAPALPISGLGFLKASDIQRLINADLMRIRPEIAAHLDPIRDGWTMGGNYARQAIVWAAPDAPSFFRGP